MRVGVPVTFVGVAAATSVSKPWLCREPALRSELRYSREDNARLRSELERSFGEQRVVAARRGPVTTISSVSDMSPTEMT
jgi:hypothetical protein